MFTNRILTMAKLVNPACRSTTRNQSLDSLLAVPCRYPICASSYQVNFEWFIGSLRKNSTDCSNFFHRGLNRRRLSLNMLPQRKNSSPQKAESTLRNIFSRAILKFTSQNKLAWVVLGWLGQVGKKNPKTHQLVGASQNSMNKKFDECVNDQAFSIVELKITNNLKT